MLTGTKYQKTEKSRFFCHKSTPTQNRVFSRMSYWYHSIQNLILHLFSRKIWVNFVKSRKKISRLPTLAEFLTLFRSPPEFLTLFF